MALLKALRPLRVNGEVLQPGEMFRTKDEQGVVDRGFAKHLTREETGDILDAYAQEAERLFNGKSEPEAPAKPAQNQGILWG